MTFRETLRKLAPVAGEERINRLWHAYLAGSTPQRKELENLTESFAAKLLNDNPSQGSPGIFPPAPPERCLGEIDIGRIKYAGKEMHLFGLRKQELIRHVGVYGSSGSGKSNAIALILKGLADYQVPFLLIDFKKTFRSLIENYSDLLVFTVGDESTAPFNFNPLIPPEGTDIQVWLKKLVGCIGHAYCQGAGSESLLISALQQVYENTMQVGRWPTFSDVEEALESQPAKGRKGMWMDSAKRAIRSLTSGNTKKVLCSEEPLDLARLLERNVILELDLLNQAEQTFISEVLLMWLLQYRMNNNREREKLIHALILEEAHHLLRAPPGMGDGAEPIIHTALREVRELGESIILATQSPSLVPIPVFANQATCIALHSSHGSDVRALSQALLLKDEAKDELGRLPVGDAIVRVPRSPDPMKIRLEYAPIAKGTVTDCALRQIMAKRWYSTNTTPQHPPLPKTKPIPLIPQPDKRQDNLKNSTTSNTQKKLSVFTPTTTPNNMNKENEFSSQPSQLELEMLKDIVSNPFDGVVKRIKRLSISRRKGTAALKAVEQRGIIKPATIFTGTAIIKLFDITPEGRTVCYNHTIEPLSPPTEGGVEHRYWVAHHATKLRAQGWTVKTEHRVSEELIIDVHAEKNGQSIAMLIESGKSNVKQNINKACNASYSEIQVISNNPNVAKVVKALSDKISGNTKVTLKKTTELQESKT